ncbi:hypothetical protein J4764_09300 [Burkholderia pseudomallei]|jgi:hypothetical protein|uniref:hypothetical protein n=1 Tax=Burkholderia TaxID=32008 RepID=UPI001AAE73F2|nr:hypothetical protein [Burkholderia cenocepacia]MBO3036839.1 hypothetical protein [Burkholderia pseudomallei]
MNKGPVGMCNIPAEAATTFIQEADVVTGDLVLSAKRVWYYSECDESAFFEWLDKLPCVKRYEGELDVLSIYVDEAKVDESALRELLALFRRYAVEMKQLRVFDRNAFASWFRDPRAYWHAAVFQAQ